MQLALDAVDQLDQIFLIAAREGHRDYRLLHCYQGFVYCSKLPTIHGVNLNSLERRRKTKK